MVMECCYCGRKKVDETHGGRTFHQFPFKQPKLLESWLSSMHLGPNFKPLRSMRLCSDHFSRESLRKIGVKVQLAEGSIPTLFGTYKAACAYCSAVKTQEHPRSFHKFPLRNSILLQKWLTGISRNNYIPTESSRLCSDHFEKTCFRSSGYGDSLRLTTNAIPTIFTAISSEDISVVAEKRTHETSQELPAAKHFRLETNATDTENSTVVPIVQKILDSTDQFITITDNDEESRRSSSPAEGLVSGDTLNEKPEGARTSACSRQPNTPKTAHRIYTTAHVHQYQNTPRTTRKKLMSSKQTVKNLQKVVRVHKQQITRLKKKISSLHDIRSEHSFRQALHKNGGKTPQESNFPAVICLEVVKDLLQTPGALFPSLSEHVFDDAVEELSNHVYSLTKQVCKTLIQLRLLSATNLASEAAVGAKKMEPSDRGFLPDESFTIQDMSDLIEFEDIKIEPEFPDLSCTLQDPIVKEESDASKRNDNSIANILSSEKQRTSVNLEIKIECEDLGIWEDEPTDSNSGEFIHAEPRKAINEQEMKNKIGNIPTTGYHSLHNPGEKSYECGICTRMYARKRHLRRHIQMHTKEKPQECSISGKMFAQKSNMKTHILIHTGEKPYECRVCGKAFDQKQRVKQHMLLHADQKTHECSVCKKAFVWKASLNEHMLIHTGEKPHECSVCGKAFRAKSTCSTHMLIHTEEKPYACSVCGKTFRQKQNMKTHMLIHTDDKPYECSVCGKALRQKSHVKRHMLTHTGQKTHECSVCRKAFAQRNNLNLHMAVHTDEKPYECKVCGKAFRAKSTCSTHMLIHTEEKPYACSVCGKTFRQKQSMKIHMLIHTDDKPYECSVCGKALKQKQCLKQHMLLHTGQKTHECSVCRKAFARKNDLNKHILIHTDEKPCK